MGVREDGGQKWYTVQVLVAVRACFYGECNLSSDRYQGKYPQISRAGCQIKGGTTSMGLWLISQTNLPEERQRQFITHNLMRVSSLCWGPHPWTLQRLPWLACTEASGRWTVQWGGVPVHKPLIYRCLTC